MPEGPEVRRAADRIARAVAGIPTTAVRMTLPECAPFAERLTGLPVTAVRTRGKAFLIDFDDAGLSVFVHLNLYGRWYVHKAGSEPRTRRSLRLSIETPTHVAALYSASDVRVVAQNALQTIPYLSKLGPDCLDDTLSRGQLMRRLANKRFSGRSLAALYLDQSFLAGVGNYLRSEILFEAGTLHSRRPRDLEDGERRKLAEASLRVCQRAYRKAGVTLDPERVRALKREGQTRRAYRHWVFNRGGAPCRKCGTALEKVQAAGRRLYFCPSCQR